MMLHCVQGHSAIKQTLNKGLSIIHLNCTYVFQSAFQYIISIDLPGNPRRQTAPFYR